MLQSPVRLSAAERTSCNDTGSFYNFFVKSALPENIRPVLPAKALNGGQLPLYWLEPKA
jgi:hypothetical protein